MGMNCTGLAVNSSDGDSVRSLYLLNRPKFDLGIHKLVGSHTGRSVHLRSWEHTMNYYRLTSESRKDSATPIFAVALGRVEVFG